MDEEISEDYFSCLYEEDTTLSAGKNKNQLQGNIIPQIKIVPKTGATTIKKDDISKKEAIAARKYSSSSA